MQKGKVAGFYAARSRTIPPLPWPSFSPPFSYKTDASVPPIIIIGHSLGANVALTMSARLAEKDVPVRLVVLFDATVPHRVPPNVEEVLNLHKPSSVGVAVAGAPGFKGIIDNQDVSNLPGIGHISIDKSKKLHAEVIDKVLSVLAEKPRRRKRK
jgi:pimeloyl-ACP methyl ester carboxylesterase